jgi:hypothetical protein
MGPFRAVARAFVGELEKGEWEMRGMKRPFRGIVLAALCLVFLPAFAQNPPAPAQGGQVPRPTTGAFAPVHALPPGGPPPRLADGHVDLSGRYYPNNGGRMLDTATLGVIDPGVTGHFISGPEQPPVFKPGMAAKFKSPVPYGECDQAGTPSSITMQANQMGPIVLLQNPDMLTLLVEYPLTVRQTHTDGRSHTKDPDPSFNGDTTAHWEGDTLVVDVTTIDTRLRNVAVGFVGESGAWFHSDQEHIVERWNRPSKNYLTYQITIEDPVALEKPWVSAPRRWSLAQDPNDEWTEYFCTHNEEPDEYKKIGSPPLAPPAAGGRGAGAAAAAGAAK